MADGFRTPYKHTFSVLARTEASKALLFFSYQQLREFSDLSVRQNKKNIPQWIYNAGEEISAVQVIQVNLEKNRIQPLVIFINST